MQIEIITPDKNLFSGEIKQANFPGTSGSFELLNNHAPIISSLAKGTLKLIDKEGKILTFEINGGVIELIENKIIVLAE